MFLPGRFIVTQGCRARLREWGGAVWGSMGAALGSGCDNGTVMRSTLESQGAPNTHQPELLFSLRSSPLCIINPVALHLPGQNTILPLLCPRPPATHCRRNGTIAWILRHPWWGLLCFYSEKGSGLVGVGCCFSVFLCASSEKVFSFCLV